MTSLALSWRRWRWGLLLLAAAGTVAAAPLPAVRHRVAVIAHRGGSALGPENTLAAYRRAIALGVDYIEIDVRVTRDRQFVSLHDRTVDRTTDGTGEIAGLRLAEARALDAGSWFGSAYRGERIPTLAEILNLCCGRCHIYLDHKAGPIWRLVNLLRRHRMTGQVLVYGSPEELLEWKRAGPEIPVMPSPDAAARTPDGLRAFLQRLPAAALDGGLHQWTPELVRAAHAAGAAVYVDCLGLADTDAGHRLALQMGVDGIQTDHPDRLLKLLRRPEVPSAGTGPGSGRQAGTAAVGS